MPFTFILSLILALITVALAITWSVRRRAAKKFESARVKARPQSTSRNVNDAYEAMHQLSDEDRPWRLSVFIPIVAAVATVFVFVLSVFAIVPTRDIGITTEFGRPVGTLDNGLHPKAPYQDVSTLDGAIQTDNYVGEEKGDPENCTDIRIGNESTACIDNSIRWRIKPAAGDTLFQDYHTMDNIRDSLVTRELKAALNRALSSYNPLDEIQNNTKGATPDNSVFETEVTERLRSQIGSQIEVLNVIIPLIRFDPSTQSKINSYQAEVANTRIAQQREQTAAAQARANQALSKSVSNDPNVLVAQCYNLLDEMVKQKQQIPAGFSCWPGGASSLVLPATGK